MILAHEAPRHLARLVDALASKDSRFFVHIDRKAEIRPFLPVRDRLHVRFVENRVRVYWGDFSQVVATLRTMREALSDVPRLDRLVLLSGSDYPLRAPEQIECFFESNPSHEFIETVSMPCPGMGKPISRLSDYKIRPMELAPIARTRRVLAAIGLLSRQSRDYNAALGGLSPYGGATWWALSRPACEYVFEFIQRMPSVLKFYEHTHCPDESFFQTIIANSIFAPNIRRNLTYTDWSQGAASPAFIDESHIEHLLASRNLAPTSYLDEGEMLFARKFRDDSEHLLQRFPHAVL